MFVWILLNGGDLSLLQYIHKQAQSAWPGLTMEQMLEELRQIEQFVLLYPGRFTGGLPRSGPIFRGWGTLARRRFAAKNRYRPSGLRIAVGCRIRAAPLPLPLLV